MFTVVVRERLQQNTQPTLSRLRRIIFTELGYNFKTEFVNYSVMRMSHHVYTFEMLFTNFDSNREDTVNTDLTVNKRLLAAGGHVCSQGLNFNVVKFGQSIRF